MESASLKTAWGTRVNILPLAFIAFGFLIFVTYFGAEALTPYGRSQPFRLEMAKKSGKNGKHANLKAREKAAEEYEKIKAEYLEKLRQPNKSAQDKKNLAKLRKKLERLRKKKDFTGENHSQNKKGN